MLVGYTTELGADADADEAFGARGVTALAAAGDEDEDVGLSGAAAHRLAERRQLSALAAPVRVAV